MPTSTFTHPLFGRVTFETMLDDWTRGGKIRFIKGFDPQSIGRVDIPQLAAIPGASSGKIRFHQRGQDQLKMVFVELERLGLMKHIKTCAGSVNSRLRKPIGGGISKLPSNHAFGVAIDLNSDDGMDGATVAPVAPVFLALGFRWGKEFNDPMHFEVDEFIESPKPIGDKQKKLASIF